MNILANVFSKLKSYIYGAVGALIGFLLLALAYRNHQVKQLQLQLATSKTEQDEDEVSLAKVRADKAVAAFNAAMESYKAGGSK